jgi:mannose-6-phosphate isomerase-like protein (cupin superfamily)
MGRKINVEDKLKLFSELWSPKIVGDLNDCEVRLVKCKGEFPWHHHDEEDEMFICVKGVFTVRFKDEEVNLKKGEMVFVKRKTEHQTAAKREAHIIYISKKDAVNTGNVKDEKTVEKCERI